MFSVRFIEVNVIYFQLLESGTVDVEYDAEKQMIKSNDNQQVNFSTQMLNFNANHFVPQQQVVGGFAG